MKKKIYMVFLIMFYDFRFSLGIVTTHLTNALNVFSTWKNFITELAALYNAYSIMQLFV